MECASAWITSARNHNCAPEALSDEDEPLRFLMTIGADKTVCARATPAPQVHINAAAKAANATGLL
jgi:hypothetical protein